MLIVWNVSNFFQNAFKWSQIMICSEKIVNLLHRGHDGTLPFDVRKKVIFRNYWNKHETAFSTIARNHRTRNISIQTILSDSNLYLSQHLLIQVRHLAPSSDYPLFKIIIIIRFVWKPEHSAKVIIRGVTLGQQSQLVIFA